MKVICPEDESDNDSAEVGEVGRVLSVYADACIILDC